MLSAIQKANLDRLKSPISFEEIKHSIFSIRKLKTPESDGLPSKFFEEFWETCKDHTSNLVIMCFYLVSIPSNLNETFIALMPKVQNSITINQICPISLYNTLYKVISKVLVSKLRPLLHQLINPTQASFIPGRQISDNIVIVQEILNSYKRSKGKHGLLAWKNDLSKD